MLAKDGICPCCWHNLENNGYCSHCGEEEDNCETCRLEKENCPHTNSVCWKYEEWLQAGEENK